MEPAIGYCTNVHPAATYDELLQNLRRFPLAVRTATNADRLPIGLWLPAHIARKIVAENRVNHLAEHLSAARLDVFTLNGFPYSNFHAPRVKHAVYEPDWTDPRRVQYTLDLARILADLLPENAQAGISTLPLAWKGWGNNARPHHERDKRRRRAAANLIEMVHALARIELDTGRHIHIDLEPEPGCELEHSRDVVQLFQQHLLGGPDDLSVLAYLRVCHDICHAAVMFENQLDALRRYEAAGIGVGKIQLSSALALDFQSTPPSQHPHTRSALAAMAEHRYLHQTVIQQPDGTMRYHQDLDNALECQPQPRGRWRVHFHVPIFSTTIDTGTTQLPTTRDEIAPALAEAQRLAVPAWEIETYTWSLLPGQPNDHHIITGIARELHQAHQWTNTPSPGTSHD